MTNKHVVPELLKTKLKNDFDQLVQMRAQVQLLDQKIQDIVGAYILGANLPQQNVKFNEEYDLLYEIDDEVEELEAEEEEVAPTPKVPVRPKVR